MDLGLIPSSLSSQRSYRRAAHAQAQVADNDLAVGTSCGSRYEKCLGSNTVIFVIEDDPQSAMTTSMPTVLVFSHQSLHQKGPGSEHLYNQAGVLHTMEQILISTHEPQDAWHRSCSDWFTSTPDFTAYTALPNNVPLPRNRWHGRSFPQQQYWARQLLKMDFTKPMQSTRINSIGTFGSID